MKFYRTLSELKDLVNIAKSEALSLEHLVEASKEISAMLSHISLLLESEEEKNSRHFFYKNISQENKLKHLISLLEKQSTKLTESKPLDSSQGLHLNHLKQTILFYLTKHRLNKLEKIHFLHSKKAFKKLKSKHFQFIVETSSHTPSYLPKTVQINTTPYSEHPLKTFTSSYYLLYPFQKQLLTHQAHPDQHCLTWLTVCIDASDSKCFFDTLKEHLNAVENQEGTVIQINLNTPLNSEIISKLQETVYLLKKSNHKIFFYSNNIFLRVFLMLFSFQKKIPKTFHLFNYHFPNNMPSAFQLIGQEIMLFIPQYNEKKYLNLDYILKQLHHIKQLPFQHSALFAKHIGSSQWHQLCEYYLNPKNVTFTE